MIIIEEFENSATTPTAEVTRLLHPNSILKLTTW